MPKVKQQSNKIIVILGPTAIGKTKLAVKLAKKFDGEIVGADSRQVYKWMNVGSGKDLADFKFKRIPYHLIDVVSPNTDFNVAKFQKLAYRTIDDILNRGKLPIVVGGAGLYIAAIVDGIIFYKPKAENQKRAMSETEWSKVIRDRLNRLSLSRLLARLEKNDSKTYKIIDKKNRRRVQRALEIYYQTGRPKSKQQKGRPRYDCLQIGIKSGRYSTGRRTPQNYLYDRIEKRLNQRLRGGAMVREVKNLHYKKNVSWKRLESFGLEYKWVSYYLRGKINYQEMKENLVRDIKRFAKRQMTWFKRDERIIWMDNYKEIIKEIKKFI